MSEKRETFQTDIGKVDIDLKTKVITIDGKPATEVLEEKTAIDLLIKSAYNEKTIVSGIRSNGGACRTWVLGIGAKVSKDAAHHFLEKVSALTDAMTKQKELQLHSMAKLAKAHRENKVVAEERKSLMSLLLNDSAIDRAVMEDLLRDFKAFKTHLSNIGNRMAREAFRKFIDDGIEVLSGLIKQKNLQLIMLIRLEKEWLKQQQQKSAPSAEASKSTESTQPNSSAEGAVAPESSPESSQPTPLSKPDQQ